LKSLPKDDQPFEAPVHARLVRENPGERRAGDGYDCHIVVREVLSWSVDVLGPKGATGPGDIPSWPVHQMMDDELYAAVEEVYERLAALLGLERIALLELQAGKPSSLGGEPVPPAHMRLFLRGQRLPCGKPLLSRNDLVRFHGAFLTATNITAVGARATHFVLADFLRSIGIMGNRQPLPIGHADMSSTYVQRPACDRLTTDRITARP
jgi:hypothetical protein